jgi:hypothetical protein
MTTANLHPGFRVPAFAFACALLVVAAAVPGPAGAQGRAQSAAHHAESHPAQAPVPSHHDQVAAPPTESRAAPPAPAPVGHGATPHLQLHPMGEVNCRHPAGFMPAFQCHDRDDELEAGRPGWPAHSAVPMQGSPVAP